MAFVEQAQVNDIGTAFRVTVYDTTSTGGSVVADISDAITLKMIFRRPDGTSFEKTASFTSDGSDGQIQYITVDSDLNQSGSWSLQAYIVTPAGSWHTNTACFKVYDNI